MSTFTVPAIRISAITEHKNADAIELAHILGYQCVVKKDTFKANELVVYIPEQAIVPEWVLERLGLVGKLAGTRSNRVKALRLRGELSQGIIFQLEQDADGNYYFLNKNNEVVYVEEEQDCSELLGIIKYEPPIPASMAGQVYVPKIVPKNGERVGSILLKYDIENYKNWPHVFEENEEVVICEKLHGTSFQSGVIYDTHVVASKGLAARGIALKLDGENKETNVYVKTFYNERIDDKLIELANCLNSNQVYILGEVYGAGIQDLSYTNDVTPKFACFDMYVGTPENGRYLNDEELENYCNVLNINRVPVLYRGPFSKEVLLQHTNGYETVSGKSLHIREGVVVRPVKERYDAKLGRVQLKSVSEAYLLRKGNQTEYQ